MVQNVLSTTSGRKTMTYLNLSATGEALYEKEETASLTVHKHFIFGPTGRVAEVDVEAAGSTISQTTKYFFKDHLGSIDLVRVYAGHIAGFDSATNRVRDESLSFDAFGQRRTAGAWVNSTTLAAAYTERGYTGHEHLDDFGLIHMNGRLYDPLLGRFLSADPHIQSPKNTQSLNRFSYVMNNPLSATDPTGYFSLKKWFKPLLQVAIAIGTAGASLAVQAIAMGVSAFVLSGGDARAGLVAAATAGMFHAVGTAFGPAPQNYLLSGYHMGKILSHGIVGGISAKLGGGNFADGFRSAAVTQAFAPGVNRDGNNSAGVVARASRIVAAAIVGGTASVAGGGKFANGAKTFGFMKLFGEIADYATKQTDKLKLLACSSQADQVCAVDERGVLRTDGTRGVDPNHPITGENKLTRAGMEREGYGLHWYDPGQRWDNRELRYFVTDVSKIHDWFNSWNYSSDNGLYMSGGVAFDSAFQIYSFSGMPVAALATIAGYAGNVPLQQQWLYYNLSRRRDK